MSNKSDAPWFERKSALWLPALLTVVAVGSHIFGSAQGWEWDGSDWQAIWTYFTFLVAAIAASVALAQLNAHRRTQREISRPYVIVDFSFRSYLMSIEVKNIGTTPAHDIELTWDKPPFALDAKRQQVLQRRLAEGTIPYLAPGRRIRYPIGSVPDYLNAGDSPRQFTVTAAYKDSGGYTYGAQEPLLLDLDQWAESLAESDYDNKIWNEARRQTSALKDIARHLSGAQASMEALQEAAATAMAFQPWPGGPSDPAHPSWYFVPGAHGARLIVFKGPGIANDVSIEDTSAERGRSAFQLLDEVPATVGPHDPIRASFLKSLGSPSVSKLRILWKEDDIAREETLEIW